MRRFLGLLVLLLLLVILEPLKVVLGLELLAVEVAQSLSGLIGIGFEGALPRELLIQVLGIYLAQVVLLCLRERLEFSARHRSIHRDSPLQIRAQLLILRDEGVLRPLFLRELNQLLLLLLLLLLLEDADL